MNIKSITISICALLITIFIFSACSFSTVETTWKFTNNAYDIDYIEVKPIGSTDDSSFILEYGDSHYVTWKVDNSKRPKRGDFTFIEHTNKQNVDGAYYTDYESLEEIVFYTRYKNQ